MKKAMVLMLVVLSIGLMGTARAQEFRQDSDLFITSSDLLGSGAAECIQDLFGLSGPRERRVFTASASPPVNTVTVINKTGSSIEVHLGFLANSCYQPSAFSSFCTTGSNQYICTFPVGNNDSQVLTFTNSTCTASFALSVDQDPWQGCSNTMAEFTLHDYWSFNNTYQDTFDISLVNGFSVSATLTSTAGGSYSATSATGNQTNLGVFPAGCTTCTGQQGSPCPGDPAQCKTNENPVGGYPCQITQASGSDYSVTFGQ